MIKAYLNWRLFSIISLLIILSLPAVSIHADNWVRDVSSSGEIEWNREVMAADQGVATFSNRTAEGMEVDVSVSTLSAKPLYDPDGKIYYQLDCYGLGRTAEKVGVAEMPFKGLFVEIPFGVKVTLDAETGDFSTLAEDLKVFPLQPPLPDGGDNDIDMLNFEIDKEAYNADKFFPSVNVKLGEIGIIRGRRVVFVKVFPFQYNPGTNELRAAGTVKVKLMFEGVEEPVSMEEKLRLGSEEFDSLTESIIINQAPPGFEQQQEMPLSSSLSGADYLIITADHLYQETLPLAQWKHKKGYVTKIVNMSTVGQSAFEVGRYIQSAYDNWTPAPSFVLLVGDIEEIPSNYYEGELSCITDQLYACVDGGDFFADLIIARLPVKTRAECSEVIDKILAYEKTPSEGQWYRNFLAAGYFQDLDGDSQADRWFMETLMTIYDFLINVKGWGGQTALCASYWPLPFDTFHFQYGSYPHRESVNFQRWGAWPYPDPVPQWIVDMWSSPEEAALGINDAINSGVGLVQHRDHGNEITWGDPPYSTDNIMSLANGDKTPVVFSTNCETGSFQRSGGDCFCEAFLKKSPGGCVGIAGATRTSYSGYNDLLTHGIYDCFAADYDTLYSNTSSWRPGVALNYGKMYMGTYLGMGNVTEGQFHMFHWFGDPEMQLRTQGPRTMEVFYPHTVINGVPVDLTVKVMQDQAALSNALVCISHRQGDEHWTGITDGRGEITFKGITFEQASSSYDLVVSERNSVPFEGSILTEVSDCAFVNFDRETYNCSDTIKITIGDTSADISGLPPSFKYLIPGYSRLFGPGHVPAVNALLTTESGDFESISVPEVQGFSDLFETSISTESGAAVPNDGMVQVGSAERISVFYKDWNYCGTYSIEVVSDTAVTDCEGPVISNVQVVEVGSGHALLTFETDELSTVKVCCGTECGSCDIVKSNSSYDSFHEVYLAGLSDNTEYFFTVTAEDAFGNFSTNDNGGNCYSFETTNIPDYFTEFFSSEDNDLDGLSLLLTPLPGSNGYNACVEPIVSLPVEPSNGSPMTLSDDDFEMVTLSGGNEVFIYGQPYTEVYAGSNGYITFGEGDFDFDVSLRDHFELPRISGLFNDFNPSAGGQVTFEQLVDRLVVSWVNVPEFHINNSNTFQVEMFFDGRIRISWLGLDTPGGIAGISQGKGTPYDFYESDLSSYGPCSGLVVQPIDGLVSAGQQGGPFEPVCREYTITNNNNATIQWQAFGNENWVETNPSSGSLGPGSSAVVDVCLSNEANHLPPGNYYDTVSFYNMTSGGSVLRTVDVTVCEIPLDPFSPVPAEGEGGVPIDAVLEWEGERQLPAEDAGSLTTVFAGGNAHHGNMFDLTALQTITITGWAGNIEHDAPTSNGDDTGPVTVEVYYVTDRTSYLGKENQPGQWTLLGRVHVPLTSPGGSATYVDIGGLTIDAGETVGIYWTVSEGGYLHYTNGPTGAFENEQLRFEDRGTGNAYPFGSVFSPRIWNGTIFYEYGGTSVTWDVYFGREYPPSNLICSGLTKPSCDPSPLQFCEDYFWQVAAKSPCGGPEVFGPVWNFRTTHCTSENIIELALHWMDTDCDSNGDWCGGMDLDRSSTVDYFDFANTVKNWNSCPQ